jgi:hypothetical protein
VPKFLISMQTQEETQSDGRKLLLVECMCQDGFTEPKVHPQTLYPRCQVNKSGPHNPVLCLLHSPPRVCPLTHATSYRNSNMGSAAPPARSAACHSCAQHRVTQLEFPTRLLLPQLLCAHLG